MTKRTNRAIITTDQRANNRYRVLFLQFMTLSIISENYFITETKYMTRVNQNRYLVEISKMIKQVTGIATSYSESTCMRFWNIKNNLNNMKMRVAMLKINIPFFEQSICRKIIDSSTYDNINHSDETKYIKNNAISLIEDTKLVLKNLQNVNTTNYIYSIINMVTLNHIIEYTNENNSNTGYSTLNAQIGNTQLIRTDQSNITLPFNTHSGSLNQILDNDGIAPSTSTYLTSEITPSTSAYLTSEITPSTPDLVTSGFNQNNININDVINKMRIIVNNAFDEKLSPLYESMQDFLNKNTPINVTKYPITKVGVSSNGVKAVQK